MCRNEYEGTVGRINFNKFIFELMEIDITYERYLLEL